jgi:hypothetical protein
VVEASIDHLRRYIELLFHRPSKRASRKDPPFREPFARREFSPRRRQRSTTGTPTASRREPTSQDGGGPPIFLAERSTQG